MMNKLFTEKRIIGFCLFLLLLAFSLPGVYAKLEIYDIDGFINNERTSRIDDGGGDFEVKPGDKIELSVELENTWNITIEARIKGTIDDIDDGDDIIKCIPNCDSDGDWDADDWYNIKEDDKKTKTLSFYIPNDAQDGDYYFELEIEYKYNGTEYDLDDVDYEVIVETERGEEDINLYSLVRNFTSSCQSLAESTRTCFDYVSRSDNCSSELSTVKEDRGTYKQKSEDCIGSRDTCLTQKAELERKNTEVDNQVKDMITRRQCNNQTAIAITSTKESSDDKFNRTLSFGGLAALIYWYYNKKKKSKSTVQDSYYYEKK